MVKAAGSQEQGERGGERAAAAGGEEKAGGWAEGWVMQAATGAQATATVWARVGAKGATAE